MPQPNDIDNLATEFAKLSIHDADTDTEIDNLATEFAKLSIHDAVAKIDNLVEKLAIHDIHMRK